MTDDYAPFDEQQLEQIAIWHEQAAVQFKPESRFHALHLERAVVIRNAIKHVEAIRYRMLTAELQRDHGGEPASGEPD